MTDIMVFISSVFYYGNLYILYNISNTNRPKKPEDSKSAPFRFAEGEFLA